MTSMVRRTVRATAAVTGMAALGAGFAGTAFADEPNVNFSDPMKLISVDAASVDGFDTESIAPTEALSTDVAGMLAGVAGKQAAPTASPADDVAAIGQMEGFNFEMPPLEFGTAAEGNDPTGMSGLGHMGSMGMEHLKFGAAGEEELAGAGLAPMMEPMMEHALPAITGGQQVRAAEQEETFGSDNGLPEPVDGPANDVAGPVTGSVMPAIAMMTGTVTDSTTNDDSTSNHEFQV